MIMKNVAIFNVLRSTELGGFTWVIIIIAHSMSGVISNASFMVSYLVLTSTQWGDYFSQFSDEKVEFLKLTFLGSYS